MVIAKSVLETAISRLKPLVPGKPQIAALEGVLVKNGTLAAYNGSIGMTVTLDIPKDDNMILPASLLDLIPKLPDCDIELILDKEDKRYIMVRAGKTRTKVQCHPPAEFPSLPSIKKQTGEVVLDGKELNQAIKHCIFAVSTMNEAKPVLTGMLFEAADGKLNFAATDSYRLARYQVKAKGDFRCVIPRQALMAIAGAGLSGEVKMAYTKRHAVISSEDYTVISRLLEGDFLNNYNEHLEPKANSFKLSANDLLEALDRAVALSGTRATRCILHISQKGLVVQNQSATSDFAELVTMEQDATTPIVDVVMGFNANLMLDCLRTFKGGAVTFSYTGNPLDPVALIADKLAVLCLPVRLPVADTKKKEQEEPKKAAAA